MKAKEFAVVVQWGAGHIYFLSFYSVLEHAQKAADMHAKLLTGRTHSKRGAKPAVMVWRRLTTGVTT